MINDTRFLNVLITKVLQFLVAWICTLAVYCHLCMCAYTQ